MAELNREMIAKMLEDLRTRPCPAFGYGAIDEQIVALRRAPEPATTQPETFHRECCTVCSEQFTTSGADDLCPLCQADDDLRSGDAVKTVEDVPTDRLIWCGIASQRPTRTKPLWVCVMDVFGLGSTFANQLCRKHGFDPDATSNKSRMLANGTRPGEEES
jgi:hypothetical protein